MQQNLASHAECQANRISLYAYETTFKHVKQGRPVGPPCVGYKRAEKTYDIDEEYRQHVDFIDDTYLEKKSIDEVVIALNHKGFTSRKNKTYSTKMVNLILRNFRYTGQQEFEDEDGDVKVYPGNWPPIR